jgi:hypothetical protein
MSAANYAASIAIFITIAQNNTGSTANNFIAEGASLQADAVPSVFEYLSVVIIYEGPRVSEMARRFCR